MKSVIWLFYIYNFIFETNKDGYKEFKNILEQNYPIGERLVWTSTHLHFSSIDFHLISLEILGKLCQIMILELIRFLFFIFSLLAFLSETSQVGYRIKNYTLSDYRGNV